MTHCLHDFEPATGPIQSGYIQFSHPLTAFLTFQGETRSMQSHFFPNSYLLFNDYSVICDELHNCVPPPEKQSSLSKYIV